MTNAYRKSLQTKLDNQIIGIICPDGMSVDEYKIRCNLNGVSPSMRDGAFLHFVMVNAVRDDKIQKIITTSLKAGYLIDIDNCEQCSYFCDALKEILTKDKWFSADIIESVFQAYPKTDLFDFCWRLNHALGLTSMHYFSKDCKSFTDIVEPAQKDGQDACINFMREV